MGAHTDTRSRIQEVALRLFTEQGYEATSLREIAEALGVTKAALYYHFRTKEDIVVSLTEDRIAALDELIAWAARQPRGPRTRAEILRRYVEDMNRGRHHEVMRFMERNQTALRGHNKMEMIRERMTALLDVLGEPGDPITTRLRRAMGIFTLHAVWFVLIDDDLTEEQRMDAAFQVAQELIEGADGCRPAEG
ncbi:TetR family transcriptional regulator [Microbispora corallina]|uniref:TetR family transcriptional regulator n=1 Tax=Microbispora corallina TaxID=83302 RepID=A0ABQ4FUR1_9ACTN|nr:MULTISPECIES: TetR/AcrR family transcriptional regulator [Microbispora]ETK32714.1 TetR family transcriptional regulator [Microbispora sp. ATCC PTA-5024]GIH38545.1 TetR family transcriptional regulator [Microbispora corallina]